MPHRIDVEKVLLHELMEESPDYIFIKDRQSRFVATNKAQAQLLLGLENPMDAVGKTDFDLFPGKQEDVKRFYEEEQQIMETGKPVIHRQWMVPSTDSGWFPAQPLAELSGSLKANCPFEAKLVRLSAFLG